MDEIVVRFETKDGLIAYEIDCNKAVQECKSLSPKFISWAPQWLAMPLDAFLFALRHGPIQRNLKELGLPEMDKKAPDKNGEAIGSLCAIILARLVRSTTDELTGQRYAFDIRRDDMTVAVDGLIRRAPEYDVYPERRAIENRESEVGATAADGSNVR